MTVSFSRALVMLGLLGFLSLYGCSSERVLISKQAAVPVGVDMTGFWQLRGKSGAPNVDADEPFIIQSGSRRAQRARRNRDSSGISAQVFLVFGEALKISQTDFGLFISYDRSVVEEYTFGENREISIGPIEALRVSGWEEGSFVVETLDDSGFTLFETWRLHDDNSILVRDVRVSKGETDRYAHQEIFDRK